jgi:tetratricopeptide (TPR) repeat protein
MRQFFPVLSHPERSDAVDSAWFTSGADGWRSEAGYNPDVTEALICAASKFHPGFLVEPDILDCIQVVLVAPMAKSQRLRGLVILVACGAASDPPSAALRPLGEALRLSRELNEIRMRLELLLIGAYVNRFMSRVVDAQENLREWLESVESLKARGEWRPEDAITMLHVMLRRAQVEFNLGQLGECWWWLDRANAQLAEIGEHPDSQARLAWMCALAYQSEGEYEEALAEAGAAVRYYRKLRDPEMLSRVETLTAEILLDLAEGRRTQDDETISAAYLAQAVPHIERAVQLAFRGGFEASEALARIMRARWQRLQGTPGDRLPLLEELANKARQNQDMPTACLAYTAMGEECEGVADLTSARGWYERAIMVVKDLKIKSVAIKPRRALARIEGEMDGGDSPNPSNPS